MDQINRKSNGLHCCVLLILVGLDEETKPVYIRIYIHTYIHVYDCMLLLGSQIKLEVAHTFVSEMKRMLQRLRKSLTDMFSWTVEVNLAHNSCVNYIHRSRLVSTGHELRCVVEIAPYQRVAAQNQEKADNKCGDIFSTEEFKRFVEELEKKKDATTTSSSAKVQASLAALEKSAQPENQVTPLMEYLQQQRQEEQEQHNRRRHEDRGGRQGGPAPSSRKERQRDKWGKQAAAMSSPKVTGILEKPHDGREPQRPQIVKKPPVESPSDTPTSRPSQQSQPAGSAQGKRCYIHCNSNNNNNNNKV